MIKDPVELLLSLESQRCEAIVRSDFDRLEELLSPSLIHTHTRGNIDNRESYLRYVREVIEILDIQRGPLKVTLLADNVALMHGKQTNRARLRSGQDEVTLDSVVIQIWVRATDSLWQLAAFQATTLGVGPPAVQR